MKHIVSKPALHYLSLALSDTSAFWVPTIDLYGSKDKCLPYINKKWYIHGSGLYRGAVNFGLKPDGRPDYNQTSTDELIDIQGQLVPTTMLVYGSSFDSLARYVAAGWPLVYHLGYLNLSDRLERSIWWKSFWEKATGGDQNKHPTTMAELANREVIEHGLPLWPTKSLDNATVG